MHSALLAKTRTLTGDRGHPQETEQAAEAPMRTSPPFDDEVGEAPFPTSGPRLHRTGVKAAECRIA